MKTTIDLRRFMIINDDTGQVTRFPVTLLPEKIEIEQSGESFELAFIFDGGEI